jgi:phosphoribosylformylglycinamidine synthase subunit PurL
MNQQKDFLKLAQELGLSAEEYEKIHQNTGGQINQTIVHIYAAMWSERVSYKNSYRWLQTLPLKGGKVAIEGGRENAGVVDLDDGKLCILKLHSQNHPCAVRPYHASLASLSGLIGDILAMGGKPVALFQSLKLGDEKRSLTQNILKEILNGFKIFVSGINTSMNGNDFLFHPAYNYNPLLNSFGIGIVDKEKVITTSKSIDKGSVFIVGNRTGNDGVHGATYASRHIFKNYKDSMPFRKPADPETSNKLIEAISEVTQSGIVKAMQDLDAAGIICAISELAAKGNFGANINLSSVPLREADMEPFEILLSETHERMLIIVDEPDEKNLVDIFEKYSLTCHKIGQVDDNKMLNIVTDGKTLATLDPRNLSKGYGAPVCENKYSEPDYLSKVRQFDLSLIKEPSNLNKIAWGLIKNPNIIARKITYSQEQTDKKNVEFSDLPSNSYIFEPIGSNKKMIAAFCSYPAYVKADPAIGAAITVASAARKILCAGGQPLAFANCLNFGNSKDPGVYWQFIESINGLGKAGKQLDIPVVAGNVSFNNFYKTNGKKYSVDPAPVIGMTGISGKNKDLTGIGFKRKGDMIYLIGHSRNDIGSSEYLRSVHHVEYSPPPSFDLVFEKALTEIIPHLLKEKLINSINDVSVGGLFISLLESSMTNLLGFDITTDSEIRTDAFLFGEAQGRLVVSVSPACEADFIDYMMASQVSVLTLGHVTKGEMRIDEESFGFVRDAKKEYQNSLFKLLHSGE